jgi:hypothetical protein
VERNGKGDPWVFKELRKLVVLNGFSRDDRLEVAGEVEEADSTGDGIRVVRYRLRGTRSAVVREQK